MADIPLHPTSENVDTYRDTADVQKQILDLLMAQKKEYEHIGRISLDIEQRVVARRKNERRMMDELSNKFIDLEKENLAAVGARGDVATKIAKQQVQSIKDEISATVKLISMSREANAIEMDMAKRTYDDNHKYFNFASNQASKLFGIKVNEFAVTKDIGEELIKVGVRGEALVFTWGAILMMLKGAYDLFNKMDKSAWDFRKAMGMTRTEAAIIRKDVQRIAIDNMAIGVTIESTYKAYQELGKAVGGVHNVTKSMAEDVAIMSAQLSISEEISVRFLRNMAVISKSSMESQTSSMYIAQYMAAAAGVPLPQVMEDV